MQNFKFEIFILLLLIGCSAQDSKNVTEYKELDNFTMYPAGITPASTIQFVQEESYGSTDSIFVTVGGSVGSIVVVDEAERVFIADREQNTIHVFQPDGQYITKMGRKGRGPGELLSLGSMNIQSNNLYVYDSLQLRVIVFSLDSLGYSHTINLNPQDWSKIEKLRTKGPNHYFVSGDSTLLIQFSPGIQEIDYMQDEYYTHSYYYVNQQGKIISDEIFEQRITPITFTDFKDHRFSVNLPFRGKPLMQLSNDNYIFSAWSEDFLIKVHNSNGEYVRSFYHPSERIPLSREDLIEKYDIGIDHPRLEYVKNADLPETWPVLHSMIVDDKNRLWISTIVDDQEIHEWWVLNEFGEPLACFKWPRDEYIEEVKNGYLYVREYNKRGVALVIRYDIVLK